MSTRSERDRQKTLQDKHQMILTQLLKDEDNKYCVDCDAKGPRWASWNLGIFLCIRCAGLHRNLGVHISKVKSVNLDTWTPEQVAMVQEMGNSRARAVYEANVPDSFRRPQSDSGLEAFIRAKYEHKKYIAHEWVPSKPKIPQPVFEEMPKKEKRKPRPKQEDVKLTTPRNSKEAPAARTIETVPVSRPEPKKQSVDLLGLDDPAPAPPSVLDDPFGAFVGNTSAPFVDPAATQNNAFGNQTPFSNENLLGSVEPNIVQNGEIPNGESSSVSDGKKSKESILALFGNTSQQQPMYGVPGGMYMQQPAGQMGMYGSQMPNGMVPMSMNTAMNMQMGGQMNMGGATNSMPQMNMGGATNSMPQMNMGNQMNMGGLPASNSMNAMNMPQSSSMHMPQSSSMNTMNQQNVTGGMYSIPNDAYNGHLQQAQQQLAALSMGGQQMNTASQYGQLGTVAAGGGGMGMGGGWGGMQQTGQTMSNNLWQ